MYALDLSDLSSNPDPLRPSLETKCVMNVDERIKRLVKGNLKISANDLALSKNEVEREEIVYGISLDGTMVSIRTLTRHTLKVLSILESIILNQIGHFWRLSGKLFN